MTDSRTSRFNPRYLVASAMALIGVILFVTVVHDDLASIPESRSANTPMGLILRYAVAMAIGGALTGYALGGLFGRSGIGGWILVLIAGALASVGSGLVGSLVGRLPVLLSDGFQASDLIPVAAGVLILPFALSNDVWIALLWLAMIIAVHLWVKSLRA